MIVHFGVEALAAEWTSAAATLGVFDGVHLGHQALIRQAVAEGRERGVPSVIVTFHPHPAQVLAPGSAPPCIGTLDQNLRAAAELGAGICVVLKFDTAMAETTAEAFLQDVLRGRLKADRFVVGEDFAFGRGREGTAQWLAERASTVVAPKVMAGGAAVSSSAIRQLISSGRAAEAAEMLGRDFALRGVVVGGQRLGRTLGFPTLNIARSTDQAVPGNGIYAGRCLVRGERRPAAISVGVRPTVEGGGARTVEAHLIGYNGPDLYGEEVELAFSARLRDEEKFDSLDALRQQMAADVRRAVQLLGQEPA